MREIYVLTEEDFYEAEAALPADAPKVEPAEEVEGSKAKAALVKFFKTKLKATDEQVAQAIKELGKMNAKEKAMIFSYAMKGAFWHAVWFMFLGGFMFLGWDFVAGSMPSWFKKAYLKFRKHAGAAYVAAGAYGGAKEGWKAAKKSVASRQEKKEFEAWKAKHGGGSLQDFRAQTQESIVDAAIMAVVEGYDPEEVAALLLS